MTLRKLLPLALLGAWLLATPAFAGTPTTNYALSKPTVSADADTWGTQLNADMDALDGILFGHCSKAGLSASVGNCTFTGTPVFAAGTTTLAPFKLQAGVVLTTPVAHAFEWDGAHGFLTQATGPTRKQIAYIDDAITGSAAKWTTGRTIALTGNVTGVSGAFDGSGSLSFATTIPSATVTSAMLASGAATGNLGFTPANKAGDTFTGALVTAASATGGAGFTLTPGVAPTSPANGNCWLTSALVACRVNGATVTLGSTGGTGLISTNNLSDVASASTSRTNLGLGTAAVLNTGTSGGNIPLLNAANTWGATQTLFTGTTSNAPLVMVAGTNLTSPAAGAVEWNGTNLFLTQTTGPTRKTVAFTDSALTGNTTGSAASLTTGRTLSITGDVAWTSPSFDGSGNVTAAGTIQAGAVTLAKMANETAHTMLGNNTGSSATPIALTAAQSRVNVLPAMGSVPGQVLAVNAGGTDAAWSGFAVFASGYVTVSGTTPTLVANNNLSTVSRTGGGTYTVTFLTAAPDANFAMTVTGAGTSSEVCQEDGTFSRTTTTAGVTCFNGGGQHDPTAFNVTIVAQ